MVNLKKEYFQKVSLLATVFFLDINTYKTAWNIPDTFDDKLREYFSDRLIKKMVELQYM